MPKNWYFKKNGPSYNQSFICSDNSWENISDKVKIFSKIGQE